jgi:ribose transport system ATP-binding protein
LTGQLSGGNKQKVVFGKWIGCGSEILILDCPTRGVDIGVKQAMYRLMVQLKSEGKTILMISEELPELIGMSDRILIMKDGQITKEFTRSEQLSDADIIRYMI